MHRNVERGTLEPACPQAGPVRRVTGVRARRLHRVLALVLALAASPVGAACVGDCDGNGAVPINELIKGVNVALGTAALDTCAAFDRNSDGDVRVDELLAGVNSANAGCPADTTPTPTATPVPTAAEARCAVPPGTEVN